MGLAAAYRTKFLKQELVKKNQIRRGMILLGKYKSAKSGEITNKVSLVLDWTPFRGNIAQRKLYVFDLDNLQPSLLKRLIKKVGGLEFTSYDDFTYHRVKFGEGIRDGSITFNKYIRDFLTEVEGAWKTYTLRNYKQIKVCDYDYSGMFTGKSLPPRITIADKLVQLDDLLKVNFNKVGKAVSSNFEGQEKVTYDEIIQAYSGIEQTPAVISEQKYWSRMRAQALVGYNKKREQLLMRRAKGQVV